MEMSARFHAVLPGRYKWSGVKIMPRARFDRKMPLADIKFRCQGDFYQVTLHEGIVVKTAKEDVPLWDWFYKGHPLNPKVKRVFAQEKQALRAELPNFTWGFRKAYLRAQMDVLGHEELCAAVARQYLVEQSVLLVWGKNVAGIAEFQEVLLQPFVAGERVSQMLVYRRGINEAPDFRFDCADRISTVAPQLRVLIDCKKVDPSPKNFILTPEGRLVYIDHQPLRYWKPIEETRELISEMLMRVGS